MADFKKLIVWQRSCEAARAAYSASRSFPSDELYGLTSQVRRAAISVSANIAEGSARYNRRDEARCYRIACASAAELECLMILSAQLDLMSDEGAERVVSPTREVQRMLNAMIRHLIKEAGGPPLQPRTSHPG